MLSVRYGRLPFYCSCDKILLSTGRKYFKQGNDMVVCLSIVAVIRFYYQQEENISSKETKPVDIGEIRSFCREQKIRWKR